MRAWGGVFRGWVFFKGNGGCVLYFGVWGFSFFVVAFLFFFSFLSFFLSLFNSCFEHA